MRPLTNLSLFSGIGGMDLGLERAGMVTVGQVELDERCRSVLTRHWPDVPRHDDVRTVGKWWREVLGAPPVDVVSGGFPCQPFSTAGKGLAMADARNLWPAMRDVIEEVRPRYVIGENVPRLLRAVKGAAFGRILSDLSDLGYVVEWSTVSACAVGAPHVRRRLFIVAYAAGELRAPRVAEERGGIQQAALRLSNPAEHEWSRPGVWLETARCAHRVADGSTRGMVAAGGNAVVPAVAERVGRLVLAHAKRAS